MKQIDVVLVKVLQFFVLVLFTFMVLSYFGVLLMLPLAILVHLIQILTFTGLPGAISLLLALPIVAYLGYKVYRIPGMVELLASIGFELVAIGHTRVKEFDKYLAQPENGEDPSVISG